MEVQRVKINENLTSTPLFNFFSDFNRYEKQAWMERHWHTSLYYVAAYVLFIYFGQEFMKNRKPFDLKKPMAAWNFGLAIFSTIACITVLPEFFQILAENHGFYNSVCASCSSVSDAALFWGWLFTLSKVVELGDTVFIVLRRRPLIFLHWYHHITVLLYCWYSYSDQISPARWFIVVNYFIHSLMYFYYGLRAIDVKVPKSIAMSITLLQLSQMVIGVTVNVYAYQVKLNGSECDVSFNHLHGGLTMYASYFLLFAHFFYKAYFGGKSTRKAPQLQHSKQQ